MQKFPMAHMCTLFCFISLFFYPLRSFAPKHDFPDSKNPTFLITDVTPGKKGEFANIQYTCGAQNGVLKDKTGHVLFLALAKHHHIQGPNTYHKAYTRYLDLKKESAVQWAKENAGNTVLGQVEKLTSKQLAINKKIKSTEEKEDLLKEKKDLYDSLAYQAMLKQQQSYVTKTVLDAMLADGYAHFCENGKFIKNYEETPFYAEIKENNFDLYQQRQRICSALTIKLHHCPVSVHPWIKNLPFEFKDLAILDTIEAALKRAQQKEEEEERAVVFRQSSFHGKRKSFRQSLRRASTRIKTVTQNV